MLQINEIVVILYVKVMPPEPKRENIYGKTRNHINWIIK